MHAVIVLPKIGRWPAAPRRRIYSKYSNHEPSSSRVKTLAAQGTPPQAKTSTVLVAAAAATAAQNINKNEGRGALCGHKTRATHTNFNGRIHIMDPPLTMLIPICFELLL